MLRVFHHANFRMMWGFKWVMLVFSGTCMAIAVGAMLLRGFNLGIDFAGGTAVQVRFAKPPAVEALRSAMEKAGLTGITLQRIGAPTDNEVLIRIERNRRQEAAGNEGGDVSAKVLSALRELDSRSDPAGSVDLNGAEPALRDWIAAHLPAAAAGETAADPGAVARAVVQVRNARGGLFTDPSQVASAAGVPAALAAALQTQAVLGGFAVRSIDFVGPTAGRELMVNTFWAIGAAVVLILLYVWFRFHRLAWGVTSIIALVHDVTIAAGAVSLTGKEFSLTVVAALLTIVGYSINDTIVVFDRIRENLRLYRDQDFIVVVNASVNQTLSRTILTSFTVFVAVTALFMYGGEKLDPMSFCLMVGVVFGTYSSVFVAAALLTITYRVFGPQSVKS